MSSVMKFGTPSCGTCAGIQKVLSSPSMAFSGPKGLPGLGSCHIPRWVGSLRFQKTPFWMILMLVAKGQQWDPAPLLKNIFERCFTESKIKKWFRTTTRKNRKDCVICDERLRNKRRVLTATNKLSLWLFVEIQNFGSRHQDKVTQQFTNLISPKFADKMHGLCCLHIEVLIINSGVFSWPFSCDQIIPTSSDSLRKSISNKWFGLRLRKMDIRIL